MKVSQIAKAIGYSPEELLLQIQAAGLTHQNAEEEINNEDKKILLNFIKSSKKASKKTISLKKTTNKVFWIDRKKIRISPKGFSDFEEWSKNLIEQEKRELENKKKILNEEMEWLSKGITARRKRNVRKYILRNQLEKKMKIKNCTANP